MSSGFTEVTAEDYARPKVGRYAWGQETLGVDVFEAALERTRYTFDAFDNVVVMFSGGKDSMAVLEVCLQVAREKNRLPLTVIHSDDEIMAPPTVAYVERVMRNPDVDMHWLTIPMNQRNAASSEEDSQWYPWGREYRDIWVRDEPDYAVSLEDVADWYQDPMGVDGLGDGDPTKRPTFQQFGTFYTAQLFPEGSVAQFMGIRAGESLLRRKSVSNYRVDNYIIYEERRIAKSYPVYDWTTEDLWTAVRAKGWDYNEFYDYLEMLGISPSNQRVGTPFGAEALGNMDIWAETWPELWDRIIDRVPAAAAAARYSKTELYAHGTLPEKPEDMPWIAFIKYLVEQNKSKNFRDQAYTKINRAIQRHYRTTPDPILGKVNHPRSGVSWRLLTAIAVRGDAKDRLVVQSVGAKPEVYAKALNEYRRSNEKRVRD